MIYALWHGGSSYSPSSIPDDLESFDSVADAKAAFRNREQSGDWQPQPFRYVHREPERVLLPTAYADCGPTMHLYYGDPSESVDPYPDALLTFGPRGGVRLERC